MSILSHLNTTLSIASKDPGCTEQDIRELTAFSPVAVPADYLNLVLEATEVEIKADLGVDGQWFLRIWGPAGCIDMNSAYNVQEEFPESLAIGDNEGCGFLILLPTASQPGIYLVRTSYLHRNGIVYLAKSLSELLINGVNLNLVFKTSQLT
jgi:hypothetical protein